MIEILKDCPYCGGKALICGGPAGESGDVYWVKCCSCHATSANGSTREEAVEKWNRRPEDEIQISEMEKARINTAIEVLTNICKSYSKCCYCPLYNRKGTPGEHHCRVSDSYCRPFNWEPFD